VRRTVPPSAEIEEQIDRLLAVGVGENPRESLSSLAKLGARLIIQRAELDQAGYTAAAKCLADDLDALVVHLRYPLRHRRRWRSTNLLERSLGEVKRRTEVIGRFPGETSCLTLVWAVLDLYMTHATNGIKFTQLERQRLKRMRCKGHEQTTPEEVSAA
jgi:transposase-like protein